MTLEFPKHNFELAVFALVCQIHQYFERKLISKLAELGCNLHSIFKDSLSINFFRIFFVNY